jgi:hypothetical protein
MALSKSKTQHLELLTASLLSEFAKSEDAFIVYASTTSKTHGIIQIGYDGQGHCTVKTRHNFYRFTFAIEAIEKYKSLVSE